MSLFCTNQTDFLLNKNYAKPHDQIAKKNWNKPEQTAQKFPEFS